MNKNIFIWILVMIMLSFSVFATINDASIYYSMDDSDTVSSTSVDISGNGINGTITGPTTGATGLLNQAYSFDASDEEVNFAQQDLTAYTVSTWLYGDLSTRAYNFYAGIFNNDYIGIADDLIEVYEYGTSNGVTCSGLSLSDNTWYHVVVTFDGTKTIIYLDGSELCNGTGQAGATFSINTFGDSYGSASYYYTGLIDEASIYNRALTPTEVTTLYNSGTPINPYDVGDIIDYLNVSDSKPQDNYLLNSTVININATVNATYDFNCSLFVNDTLNQTKLFTSGLNKLVNYTLNFNNPDENTYSYNITCNDNSTYEGTTPKNLIVDTATAFEGVNVPVNDFNFSSSDYVNVTTFTYNTSVVEDFFIFLTTNVEKQSFKNSNNDVYVRLIDNNETLSERLLRSVSGLNSVGSAGVFWQRPQQPIDNHTITLQVRRTGLGIVTLKNTDFTMMTSRSYDYTLLKANGSSNNTAYNSPTFTPVYNLSLNDPYYPLFYVGDSALSSSGIDTVVRSVQGSDFTQSRDVNTATGNMMFFGNLTPTNNIIYTGLNYDSETISLNDQYAVVEMGDAYRPINHIIKSKTGTYQTPISVVSGQKFYTETFTPESDSVLIMYSGSYNFTSATINISLDVEGGCSTVKQRTFSGSRGNVMFVKQCDNLTPYQPIGINLSIDTGVASGDYEYENNLFIASSSELDIGVVADLTSPELTITYPTNNNSNGWLNGTCTDNGIVTGLSINDSRFINVGDLNNFKFNFTGNISGTYPLFLSCSDFSGNTDNLTINLFVDIVKPSCNNLGSLILDYNETYTYNSTCEDDENLYSLNTTCTNGYNFTVTGINYTSYLFNQTSTNWLSSGSCTHIICDAHTLNDVTEKLNEFTVKNYGQKLKVKDLDLFEIDTDMGNEVQSIDLDFKDKDRVKFEFVALDTDKAPYNYVVHLQGNFSIKKIPSIYQGHFVIQDKYWLDFVSKDIYDYSELKLSDDHYVIRFKSDKKKVKFKSIGIINCNTYLQSVTVADEPSELGIFEPGECPTTLADMFLFVFLICLCILMILGSLLIFKASWLGLFGSILMLMLSFIMFGCFIMAGWCIFAVSLLLIAYFGFVAKF